jgi:hypothetical protein
MGGRGDLTLAHGSKRHRLCSSSSSPKPATASVRVERRQPTRRDLTLPQPSDVQRPQVGTGRLVLLLPARFACALQRTWSTDAAVGAGGDRGDASCRSSALSPATDSKTMHRTPQRREMEHQAAAAPQSRVMFAAETPAVPLCAKNSSSILCRCFLPHTLGFPYATKQQPPRLAATSSQSRSR